MKETITTLVESLETLIRYIAPGFVFLVAVAIVTNHVEAKLWYHLLVKLPWLGALIAAIAGLLFYGIHTAYLEDLVCYRVTERLWNGRSPRLRAYRETILPTDHLLDKRAREVAVFLLARERWLRKSSPIEAVKAVQKSLDTIGAIFSFLLCAANTTILVGLGGLAFSCSGKTDACRSGLVLLCGGALFVFAVLCDARYTRFDLWAACKFPQDDRFKACLIKKPAKT